MYLLNAVCYSLNLFVPWKLISNEVTIKCPGLLGHLDKLLKIV